MPAIEPSLLDRIHADLDRWETPIQWMYLDSEGYVTTGCGTMLPDAASAAVLEFFHDGSAKAATAAEKQQAWSTVAAGAAKQKAAPARQKHGALFYRTMTDLRMTLDAATALVDRHVADDYAALRDIYSGFDSFPQDAKLALFDMIYNLGAGRASSARHRGSGLRAFTTMNMAIGRRDWRGAAASCARIGPPPQRNAATALLFLRAAGAEQQAVAGSASAAPIVPAAAHAAPHPLRHPVAPASTVRRRRSSPAPSTILQQGSQGLDVERLQRRLNAASRHTGEPALKPDGAFGPATRRAVIGVQPPSVQPKDGHGIAGAGTLRALGLAAAAGSSA